jgi:integrase
MRSPVKKRRRRGVDRYAIDFTYVSGGVRQRYQRDALIQTASAARAEAEERQRLALMTGDPSLPHEREVLAPPAKPLMPTLRALYEETFAPIHLPRFRPATADRYRALTRQGIFEVLGDLPVDPIDVMADRRFDAWLRQRKLQSRGPRAFLRTLLKAAVETKIIPKMPELAELPPQSKKLPDAPTKQEVEETIACTSAPWLKLSIALAGYAGLRLGVVRALEVRDVDVRRKRITVRRALSGEIAEVVTPKSGHERVVPIAAALDPLLTAAIAGKRRDERVVQLPDGATPRRQAVLRALGKVQEAHGLRRRSFHSFRHAFGSLLVRNGASIEAVRVLMGHSKLEVTLRYVHAEADALVSAIAKLEVSAEP